MNIGMGVLTFNRPLHTALTLAYAFKNKSSDTDIHTFYSIHRTTTPPSEALDSMLKKLDKAGIAPMHYLHEHVPQNCGCNVDTLVHTLTSCASYDALIKIDDDVLIGANTDKRMCELQAKLEETDAVYLLMGQAVRQHMRGVRPFCWETTLDGHRIIQRSNKACPMETYTVISPRMLSFLRNNDRSTSCDDKKGTFMPFTRKVTAAGGRSVVILSPYIQMQHIGLSSTIDNGAARNWAPATSWDPAGVTIPMEHFDFYEWEASHKSATVKEYTLGVLTKVLADIEDGETRNILSDVMLSTLDNYDPAKDVPLPLSPKKAQPIKVVKRGEVRRKDGRVATTPKVVKRVIVKQPARSLRK